MKKYFYALAIVLFIYQACFAQTTGTFTDPRDGQVYKTITIEDPLLGDGVTWMAQNLNFEIEDSYVYDNNAAYRKRLGLLYTWDAAMKACPIGWHLPSEAEWKNLINHFGGYGVGTGNKLKATSGWYNGANGTNESGFSGLPAGISDAGRKFYYLGEQGYWWGSKIVGDSRLFFSIDAKNGIRLDTSSYLVHSVSVRCVLD